MCEHVEDGLDRILNDMLKETHDPTDPNEIASAQCVTNVLMARNAIRQKHAKIRRSGSVSNKFVSGNMPCPICKTGILHYFISDNVNGHIHGECTNHTANGCVKWME